MTIIEKLKENDILADKNIVEKIQKKLSEKGENVSKLTNKLTSEGKKIIDAIIKDYKEIPQQKSSYKTNVDSEENRNYLNVSNEIEDLNCFYNDFCCQLNSEKRCFIESVKYLSMHEYNNINDNNVNDINKNIVEFIENINCIKNESLKKILDLTKINIEYSQLERVFKEQNHSYNEIVNDVKKKAELIHKFIIEYISIPDKDSQSVIYSLKYYVDSLKANGDNEFKESFNKYINVFIDNMHIVSNCKNQRVYNKNVKFINIKNSVDLLIEKFSRFKEQNRQISSSQEELINIISLLFSKLQLLCNIKNKNDKYDLEYYIFYNRMNDIEFKTKGIGFSWDWRWKYEQGITDLFRCSLDNENTTIESFKYFSASKLPSIDYYRTTLSNVVKHMNPGNELKVRLASYSKKMDLDIYKYMSLPKDDKDDKYMMITYSGSKCYVDLTEVREKIHSNPKRVFFSIIKNANTNIFKKNYESDDNPDYSIKYLDGTLKSKNYCCHIDNDEYAPKCFSEFILNNNNNGDAFCIDIFNGGLFFDSSEDSKKIKYFEQYINQFQSIYEIPNFSKIVSKKDDEVVMLGNTCKKVIDIEKLNAEDKECLYNLTYNEIEDNVNYKIKLNTEEIIYLFYMLFEKPYKISINGRIHPDDIKINPLYISNEEIAINKFTIFEQDINLKKEVKIKSSLHEELKTEICDAFNILFNDIIRDICEESKNKINFILKFSKFAKHMYADQNPEIYRYNEGNIIINIAKHMFFRYSK